MKIKIGCAAEDDTVLPFEEFVRVRLGEPLVERGEKGALRILADAPAIVVALPLELLGLEARLHNEYLLHSRHTFIISNDGQTRMNFLGHLPRVRGVLLFQIWLMS